MSKFTTENNIFYTNALFKEWNVSEPEIAIYTLSYDDVVEDGKTFISLRKRYLEIEDPTEYKFAKEYFASWAHWKKVRESARIKSHVDEWREELEVMLRSKGVKGVYEKSLDGDYQASKWLAEKGWEVKTARKRGAPSQAEKTGEVRKAAKVSNIIDAHYDRMKKKER
jgi:hypothetical protein